MQVKPIIWHLLFWLVIMTLGIATVYPYYQNVKTAALNRAIFLPVWWVATYFNWWVLMPNFLKKDKLKTYALLLLATLFVLTVIQRYLCLFWFYPTFFWENYTPPEELQPFLLGPFIQFGAFIALPVLGSIGIHLLMGWYRESYQAKQIIAQQQAAELKYLKAQINPHFLFNTLNSLYGLSLEESKKVPDMILKLSDILSYSLYESSVEKVSLYKEIGLIENFIALEKERYGDRMNVEFVKEDGLDTLEIAPLLLIPLIENAFKHGVKEATKTVPITIYLGLKNNHLIFEVKNKVLDELPLVDAKKHGLGLKNLGRRLELLYSNRHDLVAEQKEDFFCARLKLELDE